MSAESPGQADELQLTEDEARSALWLKIAAHYEARLKNLYVKCAGNLQPDATWKIRGQIAEVVNLLALDPRRED